ncbi:hypothetical protein TSAR_011213 [Trichomalopsis sarcophagae]|uniref:Uncharacterized protein n=1 Tax=Trichomalopsis sarcophagae TaxID=543379 RepID=A0A232EI34_9HYME|nr:hypothetical protein TSAR_011213 [Trichomalopsis sarcophagae]
MASSKEVSQIQSPSIDSATIQSNAKNISYSADIQRNLFLKRDQALVLDCIEDLNLTDYTCAVGDIVKPQNMPCDAFCARLKGTLPNTARQLLPKTQTKAKKI